jgi:hypothetical protein
MIGAVGAAPLYHIRKMFNEGTGPWYRKARIGRGIKLNEELPERGEASHLRAAVVGGIATAGIRSRNILKNRTNLLIGSEAQSPICNQPVGRVVFSVPRPIRARRAIACVKYASADQGAAHDQPWRGGRAGRER